MTRWAARFGRGQCGRCGRYLPEDYTKKTCCACLKGVNACVRVAYYRKRGRPMEAHRSDRYLDRLRRVVEMGAAGIPVPQQARILGVTVDRIYKMRAHARARLNPRRKGSSAWAALDSVTERCKCGLLMPCERCVGSIYAFASARRGTAGEG